MTAANGRVLVLVSSDRAKRWAEYLNGENLMYMRLPSAGKSRPPFVFCEAAAALDAMSSGYVPLGKAETWRTLFAGTTVEFMN